MLARRSLFKGAAGLPLALVLADAKLARAAASALETVSLTLPDGGKVSAALALPAVTPAPAIMLVHEWWGLNDQIKAVAAELAAQGYVALAVDLYGGEVARTSAQAQTLMGKVDDAHATATLKAWGGWLKAQMAVNGRLGTVGWCFGGGWSLIASLVQPVDATVVYYGRVVGTPQQLAKLKGPVLGHFATRDGWITHDMVDAFEASMKAADQPFQSYWYEADHAFANPTSAAYDKADAKLAWERTLAFFEKYLKG